MGLGTTLHLIIRKGRRADLEAVNKLTDAMHRYLAKLYGLEVSENQLSKEHFHQQEPENLYVAGIAE